MTTDAVQTTATIVEQRPWARRTFFTRLQCPPVARRIRPGQFFMLRLPHVADPLLARPFALLDVVRDETGEAIGVDFGYVVVGKMTALLAECRAGTELELWGPLGNGFPPITVPHAMMVAGGIGQTPFLAVCRETSGAERYGDPPRENPSPAPKLSMCYGVRSAEDLAGLDEFRAAGIEPRIATDDGSAGHHGFVTELLVQALEGDDPPGVVYTCGPEPMMARVSEICEAASVPCFASLESPMACGFGACFSCVVRVREDDGGWDYRRSCLEGPVFPAERLVW